MKKQSFQKPRGILEASVAATVRAEHGAHLHVEIRIVLGGRPD
jgi:hypothetical protein